MKNQFALIASALMSPTDTATAGLSAAPAAPAPVIVNPKGAPILPEWAALSATLDAKTGFYALKETPQAPIPNAAGYPFLRKDGSIGHLTVNGKTRGATLGSTRAASTYEIPLAIFSGKIPPALDAREGESPEETAKRRHINALHSVRKYGAAMDAIIPGVASVTRERTEDELEAMARAQGVKGMALLRFARENATVNEGGTDDIEGTLAELSLTHPSETAVVDITEIRGVFAAMEESFRDSCRILAHEAEKAATAKAAADAAPVQAETKTAA